MIITVFNKKIVFAVKEDFLQRVESSLNECCNEIFRQKAYEIRKHFPLKPDVSYAFDSTWNQPLGRLFASWSNDDNSFYIYVESEEDVHLLQSLIQLNFASCYLQYNYEKANALKAELVNSGMIVKKQTE